MTTDDYLTLAKLCGFGAFWIVSLWIAFYSGVSRGYADALELFSNIEVPKHED